MSDSVYLIVSADGGEATIVPTASASAVLYPDGRIKLFEMNNGEHSPVLHVWWCRTPSEALGLLKCWRSDKTGLCTQSSDYLGGNPPPEPAP